MAHYEIAPLAGRIWQLLRPITHCDATDLALSKSVEAPLCNCDTKPNVGIRLAQLSLPHRSPESPPMVAGLGSPRGGPCVA